LRSKGRISWIPLKAARELQDQLPVRIPFFMPLDYVKLC
jgi:hypothetical protein